MKKNEIINELSEFTENNDEETNKDISAFAELFCDEPIDKDEIFMIDIPEDIYICPFCGFHSDEQNDEF
jgi:hypothetical protein